MKYFVPDILLKSIFYLSSFYSFLHPNKIRNSHYPHLTVWN